MATVFDSATQQALNDRMARLRPDTSGRWGRFACPQMLAHLNDAMPIGLGVAHPADEPAVALSRHRQLIIFVAPWPRASNGA